MLSMIVASLLVASGTAAQAERPVGTTGRSAAREAVVLTGCVLKGLDRNTYVVTDVVRTDPAGATAPWEVIYWLNSPKKLKEHVGFRVEVRGLLNLRPIGGAVAKDSGVVNIEGDGKRRARIEADRPGASDAVNGGGQRPTYEVDVKSVRRLEESCGK